MKGGWREVGREGEGNENLFFKNGDHHLFYFLNFWTFENCSHFVGNNFHSRKIKTKNPTRQMPAVSRDHGSFIGISFWEACNL